MSELSSKFNRQDIETLIQSIGDWEMIGNQEYHVLQMMKNVPLPPEDHESYEFVVNIKEHFKDREKDILKSRDVRMERATFLKAKLLLVRRDIGINDLLDLSAECDSTFKSKTDESKDTVRKKKVSKESSTENTATEVLPNNESANENSTNDSLESIKKKLELAEFFIKDLGVYGHYEKYLKEKENS